MKRIKQIIPGDEWSVALHDNDSGRENVRFQRVVAFALMEEIDDRDLSEVAFGTTKVVPMVINASNGMPSDIVEVPEDDLIGVVEPGEEKERYWEDIAQQRVDIENLDDELKEFEQSVTHAMSRVGTKDLEALTQYLTRPRPDYLDDAPPDILKAVINLSLIGLIEVLDYLPGSPINPQARGAFRITKLGEAVHKRLRTLSSSSFR